MLFQLRQLPERFGTLGAAETRPACVCAYKLDTDTADLFSLLVLEYFILQREATGSLEDGLSCLPHIEMLLKSDIVNLG
jgi:hypothetical protein